MVELLISDNSYVRESVMLFLGTELNSNLYGKLFKHIESVVSRFFDTAGETFSHDKNTMFVENCILILKPILERADDIHLHLRSVDFGSLVMSFVLYSVKLNDPSQVVQSVRIRIKMCQLTEVLVSLKDVIGLKQEIRLRNRLLEIIISWNSDFHQVWV
jgi:hypothetical protein